MTQRAGSPSVVNGSPKRSATCRRAVVRATSRAASATLEQPMQLCTPRRVGEETLQIVKGHVGIGAAGQEAAQRRAQLFQRINADRLGEVSQIAPAPLMVAQVPDLECRASPIGRSQALAEGFEVHGPS